VGTDQETDQGADVETAHATGQGIGQETDQGTYVEAAHVTVQGICQWTDKRESQLTRWREGQLSSFQS